tara:strand:+ start:332 stop:517 length:186 start_codon:yes stop_codon:yes gene_type:complete
MKVGDLIKVKGPVISTDATGQLGVLIEEPHSLDEITGDQWKILLIDGEECWLYSADFEVQE